MGHIRRPLAPEAREYLLRAWNQAGRPPVTFIVERLYKPKAKEMSWTIPSMSTAYRILHAQPATSTPSAVNQVRRKVGLRGIRVLGRCMFHRDLFSCSNVLGRPLVGDWVTVRITPADPSQGHVNFEGQFICTVTELTQRTFEPDANDEGSVPR